MLLCRKALEVKNIMNKMDILINEIQELGANCCSYGQRTNMMFVYKPIKTIQDNGNQLIENMAQVNQKQRGGSL